MIKSKFSKGVRFKYTGDNYSFENEKDVEQVVLEIKDRWVTASIRKFAVDSNYANACVIVK